MTMAIIEMGENGERSESWIVWRSVFVWREKEETVANID